MSLSPAEIFGPPSGPFECVETLARPFPPPTPSPEPFGGLVSSHVDLFCPEGLEGPEGDLDARAEERAMIDRIDVLMNVFDELTHVVNRRYPTSPKTFDHAVRSSMGRRLDRCVVYLALLFKENVRPDPRETVRIVLSRFFKASMHDQITRLFKEMTGRDVELIRSPPNLPDVYGVVLTHSAIRTAFRGCVDYLLAEVIDAMVKRCPRFLVRLKDSTLAIRQDRELFLLFERSRPNYLINGRQLRRKRRLAALEKSSSSDPSYDSPS